MALKPKLDLYQPLSSNSINSHFLTKQQRLKRWAHLGLCSAPLIGSFFYRYGYHLSFLKCPLRALTGIPCPTCGMTRSFVAISQGNLDAAINYHLFGPAFFLLFLAGVLSLLRELKTNRDRISFYRSYLAKPSVYFSIGTLYLSYYAVRIARLAYTGELANAFWASPAGNWIIHAPFYVS
jgi:Protein of unknown function (DUF2752)